MGLTHESTAGCAGGGGGSGGGGVMVAVVVVVVVAVVALLPHAQAALEQVAPVPTDMHEPCHASQRDASQRGATTSGNGSSSVPAAASSSQAITAPPPAAAPAPSLMDELFSLDTPAVPSPAVAPPDPFAQPPPFMAPFGGPGGAVAPSASDPFGTTMPPPPAANLSSGGNPFADDAAPDFGPGTQTSLQGPYTTSHVTPWQAPPTNPGLAQPGFGPPTFQQGGTSSTFGQTGFGPSTFSSSLAPSANYPPAPQAANGEGGGVGSGGGGGGGGGFPGNSQYPFAGLSSTAAPSQAGAAPGEVQQTHWQPRGLMYPRGVL